MPYRPASVLPVPSPSPSSGKTRSDNRTKTELFRCERTREEARARAREGCETMWTSHCCLVRSWTERSSSHFSPSNIDEKKNICWSQISRYLQSNDRCDSPSPRDTDSFLFEFVVVVVFVASAVPSPLTEGLVHLHIDQHDSYSPQRQIHRSVFAPFFVVARKQSVQ